MESVNNGSEAAWVEAIATALGLFFIWWQIRASRSHTNSQFLLQLHETFRTYDNLNAKLSINNHWKPPEIPENKEEPGWLDVYSYLGLFERLKIIIDRRQMSLNEVNRLYSYRIYWILRNDSLRLMLNQQPNQWQDFIHLCRSLAAFKKCRGLIGDEVHFVDLTEKLPKTRCEEDFRNC